MAEGGSLRGGARVYHSELSGTVSDPLGDFWIDYGSAESTGYRRELDLESAVTTASWECEGKVVEQAVFASRAADAMIVLLTGNLTSVRVGLDSPHPIDTSALDERTLAIKG